MAIKLPESMAPHLRIGTCSWKYDSWKGLYYDPARRYRADDYLADYAKHLNSVEIDQWFWSLFPGGLRLPETQTVENYAASVPDDFLFSVKAPNSITLTHYYSRQPKRHEAFAGKPNKHFLSVELLDRFLERLAPLGKKLGPIMFQFEYLNKKKMPSRDVFLDRFAKFITAAPKGFQYAIESRNPNYYSPIFFEVLEEHHVGFVYLDGYYMPPIGEVFDKFQPATAEHCVVRLHGGDRIEIEKATGEIWNQIVAPKPDGLAAAARIAGANSERGINTFVNVNNHYEGSAPLTIQRFLDVLQTGIDSEPPGPSKKDV
ncbi:MAG: DUF72 domain-containing protein [Candidatus Latescibacterota bacterium]|nr:MAG: DUF72 domain-containing protein [Candidatus Latescibacterota bacterium]